MGARRGCAVFQGIVSPLFLEPGINSANFLVKDIKSGKIRILCKTRLLFNPVLMISSLLSVTFLEKRLFFEEVYKC